MLHSVILSQELENLILKRENLLDRDTIVKSLDQSGKQDTGHARRGKSDCHLFIGDGTQEKKTSRKEAKTVEQAFRLHDC